MSDRNTIHRMALHIANRHMAKTAQRCKQARTLYHGTIIDHASSIRAIGLVPGVGAFVEEMYGGSVDEDDIEALVFLADKKGLSKAFNAMVNQVGHKLQKGMHDVTDDEIKRYGLLAKIKEVDDSSFNRRPEEDDPYSSEEYPSTVEPGDYYSDNEVSVDEILTGAALMRVLKKHGLVPRRRGWFGVEVPRNSLRGRLMSLAIQSWEADHEGKRIPQREKDEVLAKIQSLPDKQLKDYLNMYEEMLGKRVLERFAVVHRTAPDQTRPMEVTLSDRTLRNQIIRLAHRNPGPVRDALLPLLRVGAGKQAAYEDDPEEVARLRRNRANPDLEEPLPGLFRSKKDRTEREAELARAVANYEDIETGIRPADIRLLADKYPSKEKPGLFTFLGTKKLFVRYWDDGKWTVSSKDVFDNRTRLTDIKKLESLVRKLQAFSSKQAVLNGWKKGPVPIAITEGYDEEFVTYEEGLTYGVWGIVKRSGTWPVTHIPSGFAAYHAKDVKIAKAFVEALLVTEPKLATERDMSALTSTYKPVFLQLRNRLLPGEWPTMGPGVKIPNGHFKYEGNLPLKVLQDTQIPIKKPWVKLLRDIAEQGEIPSDKYPIKIRTSMYLADLIKYTPRKTTTWTPKGEKSYKDGYITGKYYVAV